MLCSEEQFPALSPSTENEVHGGGVSVITYCLRMRAEMLRSVLYTDVWNTFPTRTGTVVGLLQQLFVLLHFKRCCLDFKQEKLYLWNGTSVRFVGRIAQSV